MVKSVDTRDLKSLARKGVPVQVRPRAPLLLYIQLLQNNKSDLSSADFIFRRSGLQNPPIEITCPFLFYPRVLSFTKSIHNILEAQFTLALRNYTDEDGSGLDDFLDKLFSVLNTPEGAESRKALPTHFAEFPYVNGDWLPVLKQSMRI